MKKSLVFPLALALALPLGAQAALVSLTPLTSIPPGASSGIQSHWVQVANNWKGVSSDSQTYGGIWNIADARAVLSLTTTNPSQVRNSFDGTVSQIGFANQCYNLAWGTKWGTEAAVPLFPQQNYADFNAACGIDPAHPNVPGNVNPPDSGQENYAVEFTGFITVPKTANYEFSVLADDGFSLDLIGANGTLPLKVDGLNPRDRLGFGQTFSLTPGVYGFDLIGYNRLEAGVIALNFSQSGSDPVPVPPDRFNAPEPATWVLLAAGAMAAALRRRSLRRLAPSGVRPAA